MTNALQLQNIDEGLFWEMGKDRLVAEASVDIKLPNSRA